MIQSLPTIPIGPRALHLVDIENLAAGWVTPAVCREFLDAYTETGLLGKMDQVVVGVSTGSAAETFPLPGGWRRALGPRGLDCADIALERAVPPRAQLQTFDALVIASGDHYFCDVARNAKDAGLQVIVVTRAGEGLSAALYVLAHRHVVVRMSAPSASLLQVRREAA